MHAVLFLLAILMSGASADDNKPKFDDDASRRAVIKRVFLQSWSAYMKYCKWDDECHPVSRRGSQWGGDRSQGFSMTAIDTMSTLLMMNLTDEFEEVRAHLEANLNFDQPAQVSRFETVIRILGGLISAYQLSGRRHKHLIDSAADLARRLSWDAWSTRSGLPRRTVNLRTFASMHSQTPLAEAFCDVIEMRALAAEVGDDRFADGVRDELTALWKIETFDGLFVREYEVDEYNETDSPDGSAVPRSEDYSIGAFADSFYEILLKAWIHAGRLDTHALQLHNKAVSGMMSRLAVKGFGAPRSRTTVLGELLNGTLYSVWGHLETYLPGMLALGNVSGAYDNASEYDDAAQEAEDIFAREFGVGDAEGDGGAPASSDGAAAGTGDRPVDSTDASADPAAEADGSDVDRRSSAPAGDAPGEPGDEYDESVRGDVAPPDADVSSDESPAPMADGGVDTLDPVAHDGGSSAAADGSIDSASIDGADDESDGLANSDADAADPTDYVDDSTPAKASEGGDSGSTEERSAAPRAPRTVTFKSSVLDLAFETSNANEILYSNSPVGIGPEKAWFDGTTNRMVTHPHLPSFYILRPEAFESWFYMWRATRDPKYKEIAWRAFESVVRFCRQPDGSFASLKNVSQPHLLEDKMESFWLAETLKYVWLIFSDDDALDLDKYVLTTEAHPIEILSPEVAARFVGLSEPKTENFFSKTESLLLAVATAQDHVSANVEVAQRDAWEKEDTFLHGLMQQGVQAREISQRYQSILRFQAAETAFEQRCDRIVSTKVDAVRVECAADLSCGAAFDASDPSDGSFIGDVTAFVQHSLAIARRLIGKWAIVVHDELS